MGGECCVVKQKELLQSGIDYLQSRKLFETLDIFNQIASNPKNIAQVWMMILKCLKELSVDSKLIIEKLNSFYQLQRIPQIAECIAQLYFEINMYEQGNNWFSIAIEKYQDIRSPQRSLAFYEKLVQIEPKATYCFYGYIQFVTSPQFEYQLPQNHCWIYIERLQILLSSKSFVLFHLRGKLLKKKKFFNEAIKMYVKSIELNKFCWQNYQDLADIYLQTGQISYALEAIHVYCGQKSHKIRGLIAQYAFKAKMYDHSERVVDQLVREDALNLQFIPFIVKSFGYRGRPQMMIDYANQHEDQQDFISICYFLAQTFLKIGDSVNAIKYLKLIRSNCKGNYSVANNIKIARQSIKNGDTVQSNQIIDEIEQMWQNLNVDFLTKFALLLFQSEKHERVIKIYESKLKSRLQELTIDSRMDLLQILVRSSQKVEIKLNKALKKQFDVFFNGNCGFLPARHLLHATYFYKRYNAIKKAKTCFYYFMEEIKKNVFYGFPWEKKVYEKHLQLFKK